MRLIVGLLFLSLLVSCGSTDKLLTHDVYENALNMCATNGGVKYIVITDSYRVSTKNMYVTKGYFKCTNSAKFEYRSEKGINYFRD